MNDGIKKLDRHVKILELVAFGGFPALFFLFLFHGSEFRDVLEFLNVILSVIFGGLCYFIIKGLCSKRLKD